jgi:hypothetical protein
VSLFAGIGHDPGSDDDVILGALLRAVLWCSVAIAAMLAIAWCSSCALWASTGSVYRGQCTHVGLRPASDGIGDYAVTLQVSTDAPWCASERDGG